MKFSSSWFKYLLCGAIVFGIGLLVAAYFSSWIAVGILGLVFAQLVALMFVVKRLPKAEDVSQINGAAQDPFGDTLVREVMVPRTDMVTVDSTFNVEESLDLMLFNGFSRMPVCGEGIDDILGIVFARDLMAAVRDNVGTKSVSTKMRDANFIPETKRISSLLQEMQASSRHVSIAIDEFGGTAGLVTLEDLIEEIVGEITDEFDMEKPLMERLGEDEFRINGRLPVGELAETLGIEIPAGNWSTVGGFIFTTLGHIPEENEEISVEGYRFLVEQVHGRRIARVRISPARESLEGTSFNGKLSSDGLLNSKPSQSLRSKNVR